MNPAREYFYAYNTMFEKDITPTAKLIYTFLSKCANAKGESFPSHKKIAMNCGIGPTSVKKGLAELEQAGLVQSRGQARFDGSRTTNLYTIIKDKVKGFFKVFTAQFLGKISAKAKVVYIYLCRLFGQEKQAYPAHKTTAEACGISLSSVRKAIDELEQAGFIERKPQYRDNGGQRANLYTLTETDPASDEMDTPANEHEKTVLQENSNAIEPDKAIETAESVVSDTELGDGAVAGEAKLDDGAVAVECTEIGDFDIGKHDRNSGIEDTLNSDKKPPEGNAIVRLMRKIRNHFECGFTLLGDKIGETHKKQFPGRKKESAKKLDFRG